mmetsp:Transcript_27279/g.83742  ORF Transcript_27279/g.83742 Transcript_27279/m.83742 type:complete len:302 (-) Transcript_27279:1590-2495(-)
MHARDTAGAPASSAVVSRRSGSDWLETSSSSRSARGADGRSLLGTTNSSTSTCRILVSPAATRRRWQAFCAAYCEGLPKNDCVVLAPSVPRATRRSRASVVQSPATSSSTSVGHGASAARPRQYNGSIAPHNGDARIHVCGGLLSSSSSRRSRRRRRLEEALTTSSGPVPPSSSSTTTTSSYFTGSGGGAGSARGPGPSRRTAPGSSTSSQKRRRSWSWWVGRRAAPRSWPSTRSPTTAKTTCPSARRSRAASTWTRCSGDLLSSWPWAATGLWPRGPGTKISGAASAEAAAPSRPSAPAR